jgi:transcriptional regulator with XRE-family HTH domain
MVATFIPDTSEDPTRQMPTDDEYKAFLKALGARIKNMRKKKGWSLRDMVKLHDYHDSQWRKFESGGSMNVMSLLRIAEVFEMSLSKLLDGLAEFPNASVTEITKKVATKAVTRTSAKPK